MPDQPIDPIVEAPVLPETGPDGMQMMDFGGGQFDSPFVDDPSGMYFGIGIQVTYHWDNGLGCAPTAGPPGSPTVFWRCHGGICYKIVEWVLKKLVSIPLCPHPSTNDNEVLLEKAISPAVPEDFPDGQQGFTIAGRYIYALQYPPQDTDPILIPNSLQRVAIVLNQLYPVQFVQNVIGPVALPGGYQGQPINF